MTMQSMTQSPKTASFGLAVMEHDDVQLPAGQPRQGWKGNPAVNLSETAAGALACDHS